MVARVLAAGALGVVGLEPALRIALPHNEALRRLAYNPNEPISFDQAEDLPALLDQTLLGFQPRTEFAGYVLNSKSLRTPEYSEAPSADTRRVVLLGDSFTFVSGGVPFEEHWPARLERSWTQNARAPRPTEVINLSYPAVGPRFSKRMWELEGSSLGAELVILGLFAGNDFTEEQGRSALGKQLPGIKERLIDASCLLRVIRNAWRIRQGVRIGGFNRAPRGSHTEGGHTVDGYAAQYDPLRATFAEEAYLDLQAGLMELCARDREGMLEATVTDIAETIVAIARSAGQSGARFLVLTFPAEFQVDPAFADDVARHAGRSIEDYDLDRPIRLLREQLSDHDVETFDLTPALRAAHAEGPVYQPRDTHWNQDGDRVVADAIAAYLERD